MRCRLRQKLDNLGWRHRPVIPFKLLLAMKGIFLHLFCQCLFLYGFIAILQFMVTHITLYYGVEMLAMEIVIAAFSCKFLLYLLNFRDNF